MPVLKCYVSDEEERIIRLSATMSNRSVSELLFDSVCYRINQSKKKDENGEIIIMPYRKR